MRCTPGEFRLGIDRTGDLARQLGDPLHAVPLGPELFVEGDALQLEMHRLELALEVLLPKELGVRQSRADHFLIAVDDGFAAIGRSDVGDQQEMIGEAAGLGITQRETLLMCPHRSRQALGGHLQEALIERAHQDGWPFGETGILDEQPRILDER